MNNEVAPLKGADTPITGLLSFPDRIAKILPSFVLMYVPVSEKKPNVI